MSRKLFDTCLGKGHGFDTDGIFEVGVDIFNALGGSDLKFKNYFSDIVHPNSLG
jgi:hypothetical protein